MLQMKKKLVALELNSNQIVDDLKWFSQQIDMPYLESDFFFENYLVVGIDGEILDKKNSEGFIS